MAAKKKKSSARQMSFAFANAESKPKRKGKTVKKVVKKVVKKKVKKKVAKKAVAAKPKPKAKAKAADKPKAAKKAVVKSSVRKAPVKRKRTGTAETAETMAAKQRDISISEFFAKNRHLLGFDNPRKALLTAVKEAVDNSLDACEEAHILPDITITIKQVPKSDNKFTLKVIDNGPGILKSQIPNIFARLLYGSKFHSLKMSRGQQGIGISAAGMYGLITTGEPVQVKSRTNPKQPAHYYRVQIDTAKNKPDIISDEECDFELPTGTSVTITLEGKYQKGRQSVDEYLSQTAIANPHASFIYNTPDDNVFEYKRDSKELPFSPIEIKPHPYGVELGLLFKMARDSSYPNISKFLNKEFSRVSPALSKEIRKKADIPASVRASRITLADAERLHKAINTTKIRNPSTDCIGPIGEDNLIDGLKRVVDARFYSSCTRKPSVYRGNPFLIEAALAYGFKDPNKKNGKNDDPDKEPMMRVSRIANRVPLLYQQSAGAVFKAVMDVNWRNYGLSQSRGALPRGQVMLLVHIASVWVPFTSESKEAIAHYPEIVKEIKLAVQECGRKLGIYLRRQKKAKQEEAKRSYIKTYLPPIGEALKDILDLKDKQVDKLVATLTDTLERSRKF
ncbi:MAG: DNA topoisomerase VI subunit B [Planctomycetes bacterium]|nr:DNA topoisomerase VI subunit B [Planctomycetota bacterium]